MVRDRPNVLNPKFSYTPAVSTDLRATFNRIKPGWNKPPKRRKPKETKQ